MPLAFLIERVGYNKAIIVGLIVMAGGALVAARGWLADRFGLQNSFCLTVACEFYDLFYAVWGSKPTSAFSTEKPE